MREIRQLRVAAAVLAGLGLLFGLAAVWLSVEREQCEAVYQVEIVERLVEPRWVDALEVETPTIDAMMPEGWLEELDRQTDCLWELLQDAGVEITLDTVTAFGYWADVQGGPCAVLGRG